MTETATARERLAKWCWGNGLDIGHGGARPIVPNAICLDRGPGDARRASFPDDVWPTHLVWDAFTRLPFEDGTMDFVYSSHCLEDALDTATVLTEWLRVIRPGGYLVLFLPDQGAYVEYCHEQGAQPNADHKHAHFSLSYVKSRLGGRVRIVHELWPVPNNPYSFDLVAKK